MSRTKTVTFRLTLEESAAFSRAAEALGVGVSALVEAGAVEAAHRLGIYEATDVRAPIRRRPVWNDAPAHREQSATERYAVSLTRPTLQLLKAVSDYVEVTPTAFLVGATLRYIGRKKRAYPNDRSLAAIELPARYLSETK